ncbi:FAD-dependent oxidoreductase [Streptomyces sp. ODS28]|uniref:FAD-dependent oxidoreductase n=1 Tax=Streptomyces sp. ODS28 TaxID=3136688 RepID=UPI0031F150D3
MVDTIVVGGGVIGLTTAVRLAERGLSVRVWTRDPAAETTSSVAGGLIWPYRIEPRERALEWAVRSFRVFAALAEQPERTGVRLMRGTMKENGDGVPPEWEALVGSPPRAPLVDMRTYLPYLRDRLEVAGGSYEQCTLRSLDEAAREARTVVNCTGLGARELVPDPGMRAVRGQLVIVENPGLEEWYVSTDEESGESTYVLPQPFGAVLGGTAHDGEEQREPDSLVAEAIVRRCARIHPELAQARVREHRVGLRPYRESVRLEAQRLPGGGLLVHNYGHGGAGVTVSWACAEDAARLVREETPQEG